jgi:hypothetical protein
LPTLTGEMVRDQVSIITSAIAFDNDGQIKSVDRDRLASLSKPLDVNFPAYFQLRTKVDIKTWQPSAK